MLTPVVEAGCVRSLWFGVQLPRQVASHGGAEGLTLEITLRLHLQHGAHQGGAQGGAASRVVTQEESRLRLRLRGEAVQQAGDDRAWRLSRLRWLDSDRGGAGADFSAFSFWTVKCSTNASPTLTSNILKTHYARVCVVVYLHHASRCPA